MQFSSCLQQCLKSGDYLSIITVLALLQYYSITVKVMRGTDK